MTATANRRSDPPRPVLRFKDRLLRAWPAYQRLTGLSFPRRFPIAQFPNLPLIVAILVGAIGTFLDGRAHSYAVSVSYLAMTIWAYEELVHGVSWFRRLRGLAFLILLAARGAGNVRSGIPKASQRPLPSLAIRGGTTGQAAAIAWRPGVPGWAPAPPIAGMPVIRGAARSAGADSTTVSTSSGSWEGESVPSLRIFISHSGGKGGHAGERGHPGGICWA